MRKHDSQQETFFGDERGFIFERPAGTFRPSTELFPGLGSAFNREGVKKFFLDWVSGWGTRTKFEKLVTTNILIPGISILYFSQKNVNKIALNFDFVQWGGWGS